MDQEKIGKFIANLRKEKKMTQEELAERLGVTNKSISRWENGKTMPDLSLLKKLTEILGITINELLSGEKLTKEEYQEKLEENIVNTIDYSHKRINHLKIILSIFIVLVILSLGILSVLFGIDLNRMYHKEPVFFSTWGFDYVPPINLESMKIEDAIKEYLIKDDEKNNYHENEKSFVALKTYLITKKLEEKYFIYAWVLQEKYYLEEGNIINDSGSSIPYKFELRKNKDTFEVVNYEIPRDGSYYVKDMEKIFPKSVRKNMEKIRQDGTIEKLKWIVQENVNLYFHI